VDEVKILLDQLEVALSGLKHEYDLFLNGKRRGEPLKPRRELETKLLALSRRTIPNIEGQFRFNNINGRYWAYANLWTRTLRDLEEGRLRRDSAGAVARTSGERKEPVDREHLEHVAAELFAARRACGIAGDASESAGLREMLYARAMEISSSAGGKTVEFRVTVEEGKPKVKAVLR